MAGYSIPSTLGLLLLALFAVGGQAQLSQTYCSNQNTGSSNSPNFSIYQSNGLCFDTCRDQYAFAIVQYQNCWCSDYIPATQVDNDQCNQDCPGFPQEKCGNQNNGLFGYVALQRAASGTAGASPTRTRTQQTSSTTSLPSSTPSSTTSSTESEAPVTSTQVVTVSGAIVTQTVTSTPRPRVTGTAADGLTERPAQSSTPTGVIAGAVVGSIAGIAFVLLALFLLWRRRRSNKRDSTEGGINRNASVLSKAGLLATGRPTQDPEKSMEEPRYGSQRQSALYDPPESPISAPGGVYDGSSHPSRRNSRPLVYDQRLNPAAIMQDWEGNASRTSIGTMQDQRDYSRPLGVTNPDMDRD